MKTLILDYDYDGHNDLDVGSYFCGYTASGLVQFQRLMHHHSSKSIATQSVLDLEVERLHGKLLKTQLTLN
jgi:hypothetical protein